MIAAKEVTNFSDILKKSFLKLFPGSIDPVSLLVVMGMAFLIGMGIFVVYRRYFTGPVYDHSFNLSLVLMTVLTSVIIVTISVNATLSLGMVGALSIVRYRTAVKNPLDLMFLFWAITSGIAIGAQYFYVGFISFLFVTAVFVLLYHLRKKNDTTYIMVVNYESSTGLESALQQALGEYQIQLHSKIVKKKTTEMTLEIRLKAGNTDLPDRISALDGIHDVTLVQYRAD